jgi:hypothetical protein
LQDKEMSRIGVAFRAFFAALSSRERSEQIEAVLKGATLPKGDAEAKSPLPRQQPEATPPGRSEAITLLAALQREARLVDLVKQPLGQFSDEQIGAAARSVLGDSAAVLDRFFGIEPVAAGEEGSMCEVAACYDPARYKLAGAVEGKGPFRGRLVHQGWRATLVRLPAWTGSREGVLVIAPAEVEVSSSPIPQN